jgi:hypothetical protein
MYPFRHLRRWSREWRERVKLMHDYERINAEAEAHPDIDDEKGGRIYFEYTENRELQRCLAHRQLSRMAERLNIPLPPQGRGFFKSPYHDESWERLPITQTVVLKPEALRKLRAEVREELKARRDYVLGWITPFVSIIGVILGALLGYVLGSRR